MVYGAVGNWYRHLKTDWKKGRRFVPMMEVLSATIGVFLMVVAVWQGVIYFLPQQPALPATLGNNSPVFMEEAVVTNSFNTYNDYKPQFSYVRDDKSTYWKDDQFHSKYFLNLRTSIAVGTDNVGIKLDPDYCNLGYATPSFLPGEARPFAISWEVTCTTPAPIKETGTIFDYQIIQ